MGKKKKKVIIPSNKQSQDPKPIPPEEKVGGIKGLVHKKIVVAIFLFILSFLVYSPSLNSDFVWDDEDIQKAPHSYTVAKIKSHLINPNKIHYRPILVASLVLDRNIWEDSAFGFHLSSILLHSIVTVLFFFFALVVLSEFKINQKEGIALLSSIIFATIPIHVESVSFISGRADLLCCIFFMLAIIFHTLSFKKLWYLVLAVLSFALSLLSKEAAIVFPLIVLAFDLISRRAAMRSAVLRYSIYVVMFFIYVYLRRTVLERLLADISLPWIINANAFELSNSLSTQGFLQISGGNPIEYFLQGFILKLKFVLDSYLFYIKTLVFPFDLNPFIVGIPHVPIYTFTAIIVILFLFVISFISIRKKEGISAFGILWLLISLLPLMAVALYGIAAAPYAERFLYIPSVGFCLLIGYWIIELGRRFDIDKLAWAFGLVLSLLYIFFTVNGQGVWKNDVNLWGTASQKSPYVSTPYINYGRALKLEGKLDEAIQEYQKVFDPRVITSKKRLSYVANNLGVAYLSKGEYDRAERWFRKSYSLDRGSRRFFYYHMGYLNFLKGERDLRKNKYSVEFYKEAEGYFKKLFKKQKTTAKAYVLFAHIYLRLGDKEKAKELVTKALQKGMNDQLRRQAMAIRDSANR